MAIALNRGNVHLTRRSLRPVARPGQSSVVSVWEPATSESRVHHVRTLNSIDRTPQRISIEHGRAGHRVSSSEVTGRWESVRSNLALGAVFGAAVFTSVLLAGFNTPDEPVPAVPTVSSQSFAEGVHTR